MPQDLFPDREPDDHEPDGSGPAPEDDGEGMAQGLYVCLPAEQVTLAGFAQGGQADTMTPGPLLAAIVDTVTGQDGAGLAGCSDDQLVGIISAARRMQSRCAWTEMAAMTEFAARHAGGSPEDEFAADELATELRLTPLSAAEQMHYSSAVAQRLPRTFAALFAGRIHPLLTGQSLDHLPAARRCVDREPGRRCTGVVRRVALTGAGQIPLLVFHA